MAAGATYLAGKDLERAGKSTSLMRVYPVHTSMGASKINIDSIGKKGDIKPKTIWVHFKYTKWVDRGILAVLDSRGKDFKIGKISLGSNEARIALYSSYNEHFRTVHQFHR